MFTHSYKGMYIHGYFDKDLCRVNDGYGYVRECKTYRAAQLAITRHLKAQA